MTMKIIIVLLLLLPFSVVAKQGVVGASLSNKLFIDDSALSGEVGQLQLAIFFGYYLNANMVLTAAFEAELESASEDPDDRGLAFGGLFYLLPLRMFSPFVKGEGILLIDPDTSVGFRIGLGLRYDLFHLLGVDGVQLTYQVSEESIFQKNGGPFHALEFLRVGLEYAF